jgi:hypothetical protein
MTRRIRILTWVFFIFAVGLRLLLYWTNLPLNAFDNHFSPIYWIIKFGTIAPKNALWESYHPPVFYFISAMVGKLAMNIGIANQLIPKILQFVSCLYGILTIGVIYLILKKVPLSGFSRLLAFGFVCFFPRHIYMSAMHSNDTIAVLSVAVCVYLMLVALERKFSYSALVMLSLGITIAIFTKYTSFVVLPMALSMFVPVFRRRIIIPRKKLIIALLLMIIVPLFFLGAYCYSNVKNYGNLLPLNKINKGIRAPSQIQPRAESGLSFTDFKPWELIRTPILAPWNIDSFWTLIYSRMWFDVEPRFLFFTDKNSSWWNHYYQWLRGERQFPSIIRLSSFTYFTGAVLITMGLVPLLLITIGAFRALFGKIGLRNEMNSEIAVKSQIFIVLFLFNAAGIIAVALRAPVFSVIKATYFMGSLPTFSVFLGLGVMACEKHRVVRRVLAFFFGCLFTLVTLHIGHIAYALGFKPGI